MTRTVLRRLVVTIAAVALLAGCGSQHAGAAAVVGDRRISVSEVQSATRDAQAWIGSEGQVSQSQVLFLLAAAPYVQELATPLKMGVSASDARASLAAKVPNPSAAGVEVIRANASLTQIQQIMGEAKVNEILAEVTKQLAAEHFTVSPRYGHFDPRTGQLTQQTPNWLEGAEATPTPTTTP